jgi:hypothetical protein
MPDDTMAKKTEILAQHYQKTFEVTYDLSRQRNRLFVFLILAIGMGIVLTLQGQETGEKTLNLLAGLFGLEPITLDDQQFQILQTLLLVVVFHLMFTLYHHNATVLRNYLYLGSMEDEIRQRLELGEREDSFTREGRFYGDHRTSPQRVAKWVYMLLLALALGGLLIGRVVVDFTAGRVVQGIIDILLGVFTAYYFAAYVTSSTSLDFKGERARRSGNAQGAGG